MEKSKKGTRAMIICAILMIVVSLASSLILKVGLAMLVVNIFFGMFAYTKLSMGMMFTQGWKVFNHKTIAGMPHVLFIFYIIIGTILVSLFVTSQQMGPDFASAEKNILSLVISLSAGVLGTLFAWYCGVNSWMAGGSEYDARIELRDKGYSSEVIEEKITKLKNLNVIPS